MIIHKIQCDRCGSLVNFNKIDTKDDVVLMINTVTLNGKLEYNQKDIERVAKTMYPNRKTTLDPIDPYSCLYLHYNLQLCKDCLIELYEIITKYLES